MTSPATRSAATCPACAAAVDGRFCAQCGTPVDGAACAGCRAALTPGARFCHRCGTAAGARPASAGAGPAGPVVPRDTVTTALPWAFAAIALLSFGAYVAAQHFGGGSAPAATAAVGGAAPAATGTSAGAGPMTPPDPRLAGIPGAPGSGVRAPDISSMTPEQRTDRLFNLIMAAYERGDTQYVQNMAPMALAAYEMLPTLDPMRRYDLGRIAEVTGALAVARAHADTLLQRDADHLLGLALAARVAELQEDEARRAGFAARLVAAAPAQLAREPLPTEYEAHRNDINIALAEARRRDR